MFSYFLFLLRKISNKIFKDIFIVWSMQNEITESTEFLNPDGTLRISGWARKDVFQYDRRKTSLNPWRIKEWDFWEITNPNYRVIFNIFDIGLFGVANFLLHDFRTGKRYERDLVQLFTKGKVGLPNSWRYEKPMVFQKGTESMEFSRQENFIILKVNYKSIKGEIRLKMLENTDLIANVIPFKNPRHFVYAQKLNCLIPQGSVHVNGIEYEFSERTESYGVLDWTRAAFPYSNYWKWWSASGKVNNNYFGFNLDYGFGSESSKSMIFLDDGGHHLDEIEYELDSKNLKKQVEIKSNNERVNLTLTPAYTLKEGVNLGLLKMKGLKVYGFFKGVVILDSGEPFEIKEEDRLFGWAESFSQRW